MIFPKAQIKNWGCTVYQKIWQEFDLPVILRALPARRKVQFDLAAACFLMAVQHLLEPRSKLGTYCRQHRYFNLPEVSLNQI